MTFCDVRHEAGPEADALVAQIAGIAEQVVPVLESVTDLLVGPQPVIRVVTPDAWVKAHVDQKRRRAQRDVEQLVLTPEQIQVCWDRVEAAEEEMRLVWPLVMGATIEAEDGSSHVLLVPEALEHCGFEEPELTKVIAHELAHIAQHQARDRATSLALRTEFPALRGLGEVAASYFTSGHSRWADLLVTTRLLGYEVNADTGRQSEIYRQFAERAKARYSGPHAKAVSPGPPRAAYVDGAQWIRTVVDKVGTGVINRAIKEPALMPAMPEIADPDAWITRVAGCGTRVRRQR